MRCPDAPARRWLARGAFALLVLAAPWTAGWGCRSKQAATNEPDRSRPVLKVDGQRDQVGFAREVELTARVEPAGGSAWTIAWKQIWGPPPKDLRQEGGRLRFTTIEPPSRQVAAAQAGHVIALGAKDAGRVVFRVEASSVTGRLEEVVEVVPAFASASWPRVPIGVDAYWYNEEGGEPWTPLGGRSELLATRTPWLGVLRATETAWIELRHPPATMTKVRSGPWQGSEDCGRYDCHPNEYQGWKRTAHATVFERGITGRLDWSRHGPYRQDCAACHTLGYQPGVNNAGFDDRAREFGWKFPSKLSAGAWSEMPRVLQERASVQCEHCHGPGWFYVGYASDICAQCHDHPPEYHTVADARRNRMETTHRRLEGTEPGQACKGCHLGRGWLRSLRGHDSTSEPEVELQTGMEGVSCASCHATHDKQCAKQLRICGWVEIPGLTFEAGQGALCIACHNGEADIFQGPLLRQFLPGLAKGGRKGHGGGSEPDATHPDAAPHAPQFQVLTGRGGRFLTLPQRYTANPVMPHMWVTESCVGCHYHADATAWGSGGHTFRLAPQAVESKDRQCPPRPDFARIKSSKDATTCTRCHGAMDGLNRLGMGDYDGNGRVQGIADEVEGLLLALRQEMLRHAPNGFLVEGERIAMATPECTPLRTAKGELIAPEGLLQKAAWDYLMILRDGSAGIHNPKYTVRLLQNAIESLEAARGARERRAWMKEE
jgi:hypothetical protein